MLLFSMGFGTLSFKFLEPSVARAFIRKTFPYFYNYVLFLSALIILFSFNVSKLAAALAFCIFLMSCGTRESIKNKYLYSETVMQLLSDQEYYDLDKNAKWPSEDKQSRLVFITKNIKKDTVDDLFKIIGENELH